MKTILINLVNIGERSCSSFVSSVRRLLSSSQVVEGNLGGIVVIVIVNVMIVIVDVILVIVMIVIINVILVIDVSIVKSSSKAT